MAVVVICFIIFYALVTFAGLFGNGCVVAAISCRRHLRTPYHIFLVSVAISDLLFILLSPVHVTEFLLKTWPFGETVCKVQGTLIEASYTISVWTLVAVSVERYFAICHPSKRYFRNNRAVVLSSAGIWIASFLFCSPLLDAYVVGKNARNVSDCSNRYKWMKDERLSFYSIHTLFVCVLPLTLMIAAHFLVSKTLRHKERSTRVKFGNARSTVNIREREKGDDNVRFTASILQREKDNCSSVDILGREKSDEKIRCTVNIRPRVKSDSNVYTLERKKLENTKNVKIHLRNRRITRILVVIIVVFFVLWTPYVIIRLLRHANVRVNKLLYKASQLLILTTTAVNFFIYALMSHELRKVFHSFFRSSKQTHEKNVRTTGLVRNRSI